MMNEGARPRIRFTTNRVLNFTFHALFFYFLNNQGRYYFTTPFSSPVCSPNSLFRRKLLNPLLFRPVADEDLAVLLGEDAVVDSLDDNPFAGFHMDNIV